MTLRIAASLLALQLASFPAGAEESEGTTAGSTEATIEPIVVRAPQPITTVGGAGAVRVDVDSLATPAASTVEDVFRRLPMLHVRTNSRGEAELSARGSESRQVAVLVDGVPITLAWDARADVSIIPATAIHDITFTRGLASMLHGPNVLGGVVEARVGGPITQPTDPKIAVTMGTDHVGSFGTTITTSLPIQSGSGQWLARAGVGFQNSPGDPLARGVSEPVPTNDDLRLNTDSEGLDGFVALRYQTRRGAWLSFSGSSFKRERGIAAELGIPDEDARLWRYPHVSRTIGVVSAGTGFRRSPFGGHGDVEVSVGLDRSRTDIDAYATRDYAEVVDFEDGRDRTTTVRLLADQTIGARGQLRGAFTWSDIHHDESIPDGNFTYQQTLSSVGLETVWDVIRSRAVVRKLSVSVGSAYDHAKTPRTGGRESQDPLSELGARVGVSTILGNAGTVLHASVSRRGRFPALRELYSGALNRFSPNPDLKPEALLTSEAGATFHSGTAVLQAVVFHNLLQDAVVRITTEEGLFKRVNRDELETTGIELIGSAWVGPLNLSANATLQSVSLTDTDTGETHRPENLPEIFGDLTVDFPLPAWFAGHANVALTGDQFVIDGITGEDTELPARAVVNGSISRSWRFAASAGGVRFTTLETTIGVDNVTDVAQYDAWGLPEPGRRVRLELRLR